jgi:hypothetical protein
MKFHLRAIGYFVFYRFMGACITRPEQFGLIPQDQTLPEVAAFNLVAISKVLRTTFMLAEEKSGPYCSMNEWILEKHDQVREYIKDVIDVEDAEEKLKVNKYAQYASKDKTVIVIPLKDMCQLHQLLFENKPELTTDEKDHLAVILDEIGKVRRVPDSNHEEVQLTLNNKFPPALRKDEIKKNVKTETINEAIKVLRKIPGFSGDTFLEIFVRMKLHCKKIGEDQLANEVNQVIANLQNLAKYGLVSPKDGFNSFLKDISDEIQERHARRQEHLKELERLKVAISELEEAKKHMDQKNKDFKDYLDSVRLRAKQNFKPKTKSFKFKELSNGKIRVIADSEIPVPQQGKVVFEITHAETEKFLIKGKIKGIAAFSRNFELNLSDLLTAKENGEDIIDTDI